MSRGKNAAGLRETNDERDGRCNGAAAGRNAIIAGHYLYLGTAGDALIVRLYVPASSRLTYP